MAGREKQLLAMKKKLGASDSTYIAAVVKAAKVAAEFAGVKLGHTKTLATKENIKFSNAKKVQAAILRAKQKGEPLSKRDVAALQAKHAAAQPKAASGVGANTTRGSYIDHGVMLKYTWDKFGVDYRTAPEKKAMHGLGLEARLGIPVEKNRAKKVKKGLFSAFSKSFPLHIDGRTPMSYNPDNCGPCHTGYPSMWWYDEMLARLADPIYDASGLPWESPSGYVTKVPPRPNPFITPYPFRRSLHGGRAERAGKRAKDFDKKKLKTGAKREEEHTDDPHEAKQIAMDHLIEDPSYYAKLAKLEQNERIRKAIGTKQSEEMKGPKKAPPPTKSSGQTVDPKNGKKRYEYKGQTPDKGKPAKKEKGGASDQKTGQKPKGPPGSADQAQAEAPPPPPQINVQEAANALHITVGTLSAFAKHFKDVEQFTAYLKATVRPFLIKHNVGEDALRRLYEQLNPPQQSDQKPEQPPQNALGQ
jgi:hypothetical protein